MRTIHRLIEAKKAQREEEGNEAGFSLIELIIVVVIIGILAAIAIPIFSNIQKNAVDAAGQSAASNGATTAAIEASKTGSTLAQAATFPELVEGSVTGVVLSSYTAGNIASICVTATVTGGNQATWSAGPAVITNATTGATSCP